MAATMVADEVDKRVAHCAKSGADTLVTRLTRRAAGQTNAPAFLQKRHGIWHTWTWGQVSERTAAWAAGLLAAGLARGDAVAIVSGARIEAVLMVLACQRAGLVPVLLSANLAPGGLATMVQQAGALAVVAEDQEQVDKIADVQSRLEALRAVWVIDPKGTRAYRHILATSLQGLDGAVPRQLPEPAADDDALGLFSAGVFSEPRPVRITHATVMQLASARDALDLVEGERCVCLFALADALGHFMAVVAPVLFGTIACFGEERLPSVPEMRQLAPRVVALPARLLDRLRRETAARASRSSGWQRRLIQRWHASSTPNAWQRWLVARPLANGLGLGQCRVVMTGYERMAPASARFLARLGITTRGLYGLAEAAGPVAAFALAEEPALELFEPYRPTLQDTEKLVVHVGGQAVPTGDLVTLDGGRLHLVGRAADLLTLPDGRRLAPSVIEAELMASPYVNQAVAVGGPASGITALVELDEVTLRDWARAHGLAFTTLRSFAQSSEVVRLIEQARSEANQRLEAITRAARIVRVVLLPRALEAANGELTPSLALRRAIVRNRYAHRLLPGGPPLTPSLENPA